LIIPIKGSSAGLFYFDKYMTKTIIFFSLSLLIIFISVIDIEAEERPSLDEGKRLYLHYCASCHGANGDGRGFNAENLDPRPAVHSDGAFMSKRTDKELAAAVAGGGRMIGKATLMPPWGGVFSISEIESIVTYMRKLCGCKGSNEG
jgi:mono/diheme cytochrome c family protein